MKWLAVLDMDGTILEQRTIDVLCRKLGLTEQLKRIDEESKSRIAYKVSTKIASLFEGIKVSKMKEAFHTIPIVEGAKEFIDFLKSRNFITAIVTDSYTFLASELAQRLCIDTVTGNQLETVNDTLTGKITMPFGWEQEGKKNCQKKAVCKLYAMNNLIRKYSVPESNTMAVGDSQADSCILQMARIGVAFRPKDLAITDVADVVIQTDFFDLINWLKDFLDRLSN